MMIRPRCLECNRVVGGDGRRGLCGRCRRDTVIRDSYDTLPRGCWTEDAKQWDGSPDTLILMELFGNGLSDKQIALQMGRSVGGVCKARQRLGLKVSRARQAKHRKAAWVEREPGEVSETVKERTKVA